MNSPYSLAFHELAESLRNGDKKSEVEAAWRAGNLDYKFWPIQKEMAKVLESDGALKKVLKCSRRLRKTTTALALSMSRALRNKVLIRFAAATRDSLIDTIFPIMDMLTDDCPEDIKPQWNQQKHQYFFPSTQSIISVAGCDNLKAIGRLRGRAADLCVVDEAQEIVYLKYLIDDVLMPQLMGIDKPRGPLWILFTPPKTPVHDVIGYFQEAKLHGTAAEFNIYRGGYAPSVIETFKQEAGGENSTTWKREYLVQEVVDENYAVVPEWRDEFIEEYVPDEFYKYYARYVGMDIGVRDLTPILFCVYDFKKAILHIQDEIVFTGPQMTTDKVAQGIKDKEKELWDEKSPKFRISDNNNLILLQDLGTLHKLFFAPTTKDTLEAMVNHLRLFIKSGRIRVSPKCVQTIGCLKYGVWNNKREDFERSSNYGHFDALAALMYLVRNVNVATNPIPANHGLDPKTQWINSIDTKTQNAQTVRRALLGKRIR